MKVLLSAYACTPNAGSEPGVGFATLLAAAEKHEVWVITRRKNREPILEYLRGHPAPDRVTVLGIDLSPGALWFKKRFGGLGLQWYYDRWQLEAARVGAALASDIQFDLVHHVTFASDWARAGVGSMSLPLVWGPIGGGVLPPLRLLTILGIRGMGQEMLRATARALMRQRPWYRAAWRNARVVLVQNEETAGLGGDSSKITLLPNSTALLTEPREVASHRNKQILVVGRLLPWKGGRLALAALKHVRQPGAMLVFLGDGSGVDRFRASAARMGLTERVRFEGSLPRDEVLARVASAGVLLHPAMHDESPVAVGEALSLGTPVVCLDRGGPPELLKRWPASPGTAIPIGSPDATARRLGQAVDRYLGDPPPIAITSFRPTPSYAESLLAAYNLAVGIRAEPPE
ncbi:MAG: glycosyltransferase [Acidimicrobiia bacterium]